MNLKEFFVGTPEEQEAAEKIQQIRNRPKLKPKHHQQIKNLQKISRRRFLRLGAVSVPTTIGAAALAEWRFNILRLFSGSELSKGTGRTKNVDFPYKPEIAQNVELLRDPEWMKEVELPTFEYKENEIRGTEELTHLFLPEGEGRHREIAQKVEQVIESLKSDLEIEMHSGKRQAIINRSFGEMQKIYWDIKGKDNYSTNVIYEEYINRVLLSSGHYAEMFTYGNMGASTLFLHEVDKVRKVNTQINGVRDQVQIVHLKNWEMIGARRSGTNPLALMAMGLYLKGLDTLVIMDDYPKNTLMRQIQLLQKEAAKNGVNIEASAEEILDDYFESNDHHELLHGALYTRPPEKKRGTSLMRPRGDIDMGNYTLRQRDYLRYKTPTGDSVQELAASGYGLFVAKKATKFVPPFPRNMPEYDLANLVFIRELIYSPYIDEETRQNLIRNASGTNLFKALIQVPDEQLNHIGLRMAKLGIYLSQ